MTDISKHDPEGLPGVKMELKTGAYFRKSWYNRLQKVLLVKKIVKANRRLAKVLAELNATHLFYPY